MAAAYVRVYMNGCHVRTYGGNKSDVRWMEQRYKNMTREEFMNNHPALANRCKRRFKIKTELVIKWH